MEKSIFLTMSLGAKPFEVIKQELLKYPATLRIFYFMIPRFKRFLPLYLIVLSLLSPNLAALAQVSPSSHALDRSVIQEKGVLKIPTATSWRDQPSDNSDTKQSNISEIKDNDSNVSYTVLMRRFHEFRKLNRQERSEDRIIFSHDFRQFIQQEKERLDTLEVEEKTQKKYFKRLEKMEELIFPGSQEEKGFWTRVWEKIQSSFIQNDLLVFDEVEEKDTLQPEHPAQFKFADDLITIKKLRNPKVKVSLGQKIPASLKKLVTIEIAQADTVLPVVDDIQPSEEVVISSDIRALAKDFQNNPVAIQNFLRQEIRYEPYFGAKKGSVGCLRERVCNDVDASSLAIALLRASGIPARYVSSPSVFSVEQLKSLLGVDETTTVYVAFAQNNVPVYIVSDNPLPEKLDDADLSGETHLAVEWVHVEAFYDYDDRGANIDNTLDLQAFSSTNALQSALTPFAKKQWIPIDPMIQPYTRIKKTILVDQANFNSENFFYSYLQSQGAPDPMATYSDDLQKTTGFSVNQFLSTKKQAGKPRDISPITLPFFVAEGTQEDGSTIGEVAYSILPDAFRYEVEISLLRSSDKQSIFKTVLPGSVVNNEEFELYYEGYTDLDQAVINSYGGVHLTPTELVDVRAKLRGADAIFFGSLPLDIGESVILQFRYLQNGKELYLDEKFSTSGNQEGIYIALSHVIEHPFLENTNDPEKNSKILLEGNAAMAREYLLRVQQKGEFLKQSLDSEYIPLFTRAVVTQKRILNTTNGLPTTFDFKGFSIDATTFIVDYSNRGNYKNHRKDFRLLWGLFASYYEGQLFTDLAGLSGVSTVTGIQYAYANPATYTIHIIKSANKNFIDSLSISDNTKQNMKTDVDKGNTIITPNKTIEKGTWKGILYISLDPKWTGTYAIGEQTSQNGGWTTDEILVASVYDPEIASWSDYYYLGMQLVGGKSFFGYQDMPQSIGSISCILSETTYNTIKSESGWEDKYGFPCRKETISFGPVKHTYILATKGAKFHQDNQYSYWISSNKVLEKLTEYEKTKKAITSKDIQQNKDLELIKMNNDFELYKLKFSAILGTYINGACENQNSFFCPDDEESVVYYSPNANSGSIFRVKGKFLDKLDAASNGIDKYVIKQIGFPVDHEKYAGKSPHGTTGNYQNFVNGQLYFIANVGKVAFMPQAIVNVFNSENGTWGKLGFPSSDPYPWKSTLAQDFETGRIEGSATGYTVSPIWYSKKGDHHFLVINLNPNVTKRACFKSYVGLADGITIGDKNSKGELKKNFKAQSFSKILSDSAVQSVKNNRKLNGYEPIAAINADLVDDNGAPMGINFSLGNDYSGWRDWWTGMGISKKNEVTFTGNKNTLEEKYKQTVVGGGPKIIVTGDFTEKSCEELLGKNGKDGLACTFVKNSRTVVGITDKNYMIVVVSGDLDFEDIFDVLHTYKNVYGSVQEANMFDGGGSPSMLFENSLKREGGNDLSSLLLMYSGDACN